MPSGNQSFFGNSNGIFNEIEALAQVGGWVLDVKSGETHWTNHVYLIHDLDEESTTDLEKGLNYYTQPSRGILNNAIGDCLEKGTPFRLKLELKSAKEELKDVLVAGKPVFENGRVIQIIGAIQDITESEKQLKQLVYQQIKINKAESISSFGYYETDLVKNTWTGSDRFYDIFGFDKRDEPFTMEQFQAIVHPEDFDRVMSIFADSLSNQKDFYA